MILVDHLTRISKSSLVVYIIQSEVDGTYYVGFTTDINRRLTEHNQGQSTYTKAHRPYRLIYTEVYLSIKDAKAREKYIKAYKNIANFLKSRVPPTS